VEVLEAAHYGSLPKDLLELRAFDDVGELHMVMMGGKLRGRVRKDGEGTPCDVFDEEHLLWGERVSRNEGSYVLREDRGTRIAVPEAAFEGLCEPGGSSQDKQNRVTVRVRNYLDKQDESPLTGDPRFAFCDYRLVCFNVREVEKRGEV
jgi:CRISPR-associated protein (TIGR03984 family)